jgi:WLM domain
MNTTLLIIVTLMLVILIFYHNELRDTFINRPQIISSYPNWPQATKLLNDTNNSMLDFMKYVKKKYHINETDEERLIHGGDYNLMKDPDYVYFVELLIKFNPEVMYENDPNQGGITYTINKGDKMMICLRSADNPNQLVDKNTLIFVILHECTHEALYDVLQHPRKFWQYFKRLLGDAVQASIYNPIDYSKYPVMYCGLNINYNPLYDKDLSE